MADDCDECESMRVQGLIPAVCQKCLDEQFKAHPVTGKTTTDEAQELLFKASNPRTGRVVAYARPAKKLKGGQ